MLTLTCGRHGLKSWRGEVVCDVCERVYTTHDPDLPTHAPTSCACGSRLMPDDAKPSGGEYSARACCSECFAGRTSSGRGDAQ